MESTFHISLPCKNIEETIKFYEENLNLEIGRKTNKWVDINLFGNQITFVLTENYDFKFPMYSLDDIKIPSFHFGVIFLENNEWDKMHDMINNWSTETIIRKTFFGGKNGEHYSFFVKDPNGYVLEFKTFADYDNMFG